MQIQTTNITFSQINNQQKQSIPKIPNFNVSIKTQLDKDTVSFKGKDLLSEQDSTIIQKIKNSINNLKNLLGEGEEAIVYKLPDTDYCVRLEWKATKSYIDSIKKITRKISEQDKVNHIVCKMGENVTIMKYIPGEPVMKPLDLAPQAILVSNNIAALPKKSYQHLIKQICDAYKKDMMFDCNWTNVLVDKSTNSLTAIDFYKIDPQEPEKLRPLEYVYESLTNEYTPKENKKIFVNKILNATLDEYKLGKTPHFDLLERTSQFINHILKDLRIKDMQMQEPYKKLEQTLKEIRELKTQEIQLTNVNELLNSKLTLAKKLITNLF